jgi:antitoxin (DNA-binding transcriptional repressor) of toxin-antitoxin stability system
MTVVTVEEFRASVDRYLTTMGEEELVLTRDGKPFAVIQPIPANGDGASADFANSAVFWRMIRQRRQEQGIPWEEAKKQLGLD